MDEPITRMSYAVLAIGGESFVIHWLFTRSHQINMAHKSRGFDVRSEYPRTVVRVFKNKGSSSSSIAS